MIKKIFILIIIFAIIGCISFVGVARYTVQPKTDSFENSVTYYMKGNCLIDWTAMGCNNKELNGIYLNAFKKVDKSNNQNTYGIIATYDGGSGWFFIERGESLIFLADGERIGLTGEGSWPYREVGYAGHITEKAYYIVTPEQFRKIALAKNIQVRIIGSKSYFDLEFNESNIESFYKFYNEYVANN